MCLLDSTRLYPTLHCLHYATLLYPKPESRAPGSESDETLVAVVDNGFNGLARQVANPTAGGGRVVDDRDEADRPILPLIDPDAMAKFRATKAAEARRNPFA